MINFVYVLHVLAAVIWVGGMFFAYQILRPVAASLLEAEVLLSLWKKVFQRFFPWVWVIIFVLPLSGYFILFQRFQGFAHAPIYIHLMHTLGLVMIIIYLVLFFRPFKRLTQQVSAKNWPEAKIQLASIRRLVGFNTLIGLITIAIASSKFIF